MGLSNFGSKIAGIAGFASGLLGQLGRNRDGGHSAYNVGKFLSEINQTNGLYKPNLFFVEIFPKNPQAWWAGFGGAVSMEPFRFLCNSASLPGIQILASDHRRQNFGSMDRRPYNVQTTDIPLTFFIDGQGYVPGFFQAWARNVINFDYTHGEHSEAAAHGAQLFETSYRDRYLCTIKINCLTGAGFADGSGSQLGRTNANVGFKLMEYTLHEAWPLQIGDVTTAWSETDTFATLPVQFTFRTYDTLVRQQYNSFGSRALGLGEILGLISGGIGILQGLNSGNSKQAIIANAVNVLANRKIYGNLIGRAMS